MKFFSHFAIIASRRFLLGFRVKFPSAGVYRRRSTRMSDKNLIQCRTIPRSASFYFRQPLSLATTTNLRANSTSYFCSLQKKFLLEYKFRCSCLDKTLIKLSLPKAQPSVSLNRQHFSAYVSLFADDFIKATII